MTLNTIKFSQFAQGSLSNTTNKLVGVSSDSGGNNIQVSFPLIWTTAARPTSPALGTQGYNSSLGQVEYWNGGAWVQLAAGGSGTVGIGAANQLAWYEFNGTSVVGLNTGNNAVLVSNASGTPSWLSGTPNTFLISDASGIPTWSSTLNTGLVLNQPIINQPNIVGITNGSNAAAGSVGEVISAVANESASVSLTNTSPTNVVSIVLTPGQFLVFGNFFIQCSSVNLNHATGWISQVSATQPDPSLYSTWAGFTTMIGQFGGAVPMQPINVTTTTVVYLGVNAGFGAGSASACGGIYAVRIR